MVCIVYSVQYPLMECLWTCNYARKMRKNTLMTSWYRDIILSDNYCLSPPVGSFDLQHHPLYKHIPAAAYRRIFRAFTSYMQWI
jgi:hypothetical protein